MQALNTLAVVYATFEKASANLEVENSERDRLCADVPAASELKDSRESLDIATMDMQESMSKLNYCGDLHDAAYRGLEDCR